MSVLSPAAALAAIASAMAPSALELTFHHEARTITFESAVEQHEETTDPLPTRGYLVIAQFPNERHPDMLGSEAMVEVVSSKRQLPHRLHGYFFDFQPAAAATAYVFDLATGQPVGFRVVTAVRLAA